ncbi:MAG: phosphodiester glycosidase family protein, partial [Succiniclasticum sp.]|nr:phosphodiester glycosidase family protein [Succiniclasticum sp.]
DFTGIQVMKTILNRIFAGTSRIIPLVTALLLCLQATVQAQITGMRVGSGATRIRIVLDMDEPAKYKDNSTKNGVVLDIDTAANKMQRKIDDASIADISLIKKGKKKSQLVVGLKKPAQHKVTVLKKPNRLVIDVYRIQIVKVTKDLGNGLAYTFWQDDMSGLPVRIYALTLAPDSRYELRPFSGAGAVNGRGRLAKAVAANGARAAVNACYFDTDGWVIGNCKWDGSFFGVDDTPRSAFIVDKEGKASIQKDLSYLGTVSLPDGRTLTIKGLNRQRITDDLVLFNRNYAGSTRTNEHGREVRVSKGRATEVSAKGNMRLDRDSLVLSGHGANADALAHIRRGDRVAIAQTLGSRLADEARLVVGGGPLLVEKGVVNVRSREESMASDIAYGRAPRTGVGVKADGTVLLMVVDGRSQYSAGMSLKEFATYLKRFGAVSAVNLDGGGSSVMVLDGKIMNRPSDGSERPVSIGLGIFRKEQTKGRKMRK